jgi:hypothetical protein
MRRLLLATTALLALSVAPASAFTIDIIATFNQNVSFSDPAGVSVETYAGTGSNQRINTAGGNGLNNYISADGPGGPANNPSGLFIGNITNDTSPFGKLNDSRVYLSAGGGDGVNGGVVALSGFAPSNSLGLLWGTVDSGDFRNRIVTAGPGGLDVITGSMVLQACHDQGFTCGEGDTNVFLRINGLDTFTSAKFTDRDANSFEFVPLVAAVPEASTWAMMILGFIGMGFVGMRKKLGGVRIA